MRAPLPVLAGLLGAFAMAPTQAGTPSCGSAARYTVVDLPFIPKVITPSGVVAGMTELHRAVVWRRESGPEELSVPEGFRFTEPAAITTAGDVVINAFDAEGTQRGAFIYSHSSHSVFKLGGNQTWARGIGAAGLVVGEWVPEGKTATDAVYWNNTVPHSIGLCCSGTLKGANARGDMAGDVYDEQGHYSSPWIRNGIRRQR